MSVKVSVVMGSDSDLPVMSVVESTGFDRPLRSILSAHRLPEETADFARNAAAGFAGNYRGAWAAHLAGLLLL